MLVTPAKLIACLWCRPTVCQTWLSWISRGSHQRQLISSSPHNALGWAHTIRAKIMFNPVAADLTLLVAYLGFTSRKSKVRWKGTIFSPFSFDPCMTHTEKDRRPTRRDPLTVLFSCRRAKLTAENSSSCSKRTLCSCTYVLDVWLAQSLFDKIFTKLHCK
jgi:hypothetical protein